MFGGMVMKWCWCKCMEVVGKLMDKLNLVCGLV